MYRLLHVCCNHQKHTSTICLTIRNEGQECLSCFARGPLLQNVRRPSQFRPVNKQILIYYFKMNCLFSAFIHFFVSLTKRQIRSGAPKVFLGFQNIWSLAQISFCEVWGILCNTFFINKLCCDAFLMHSGILLTLNLKVQKRSQCVSLYFHCELENDGCPTQHPFWPTSCDLSITDVGY